jgi:aspartyl-tRNA(Asn)/glutamyl-tRNA(Gln) amidotransferase subunit C
MITKDEVIKIAGLARISLTEEEVLKFQADLSKVLDYVEELKQVDTNGLDEVSSVTGLSNVLRLDEVVTLSEPADVLKEAPSIQDGYYKVKAIFN